jgi:hypothetical protein
MTGGTTPGAAPQVGPVLDAGDIGTAIAAAILSAYPDAVIQDRGAYLRVRVPRRCTISRAAIEAALGRPFHLPSDLEQVMPSFQGRFAVSEAEASWFAESKP